MMQPYPEPLYFDPQAGSEPVDSGNLLEGRLGIVAVVVGPEAHSSGWAGRAIVALAEHSLAAGHPAGLLDLALEDPSLHAAAGVPAGEGVSDVILFGASIGHVSKWTAAGARVVTAGTAVAEIAELFAEPGWAEAVREAADDGCVLAYVPTGAAGGEEILREAEDVIILRHHGEDVDSSNRVPTLVLEPKPAEEAVGLDHALDDDALDDGVSELLSVGMAAAAPDAELSETDVHGGDAPTVDAAEANVSGIDLPEAEVPGAEVLGTDAPEPDGPIEVDDVHRPDLSTSSVSDTGEVTLDEVTLDLDDVAGDSDAGVEPMFAAASPAPAASDPDSTVLDAEVAGLEIEPEWPDFEVPLVVQDPGEVDPLIAAVQTQSGSDADATDSGLDGILEEGVEVRIVSDDLGAGPPVEPGDEVATEMMDGLVDRGLGTLNPAGEESSDSADHVSGLEGPPGWDEPPTANSAEDVVDLDPSDAEELERMDDPWGEPIAEPSPAASPSALDPELEQDGLPLREPATVADALPWEELAADVEQVAEPEVSEESAVPVADVTRTRTRTRTKGPRPFLLIVFLLLVAVVAILHWVGLLDVAGLNFSLGDAF